MNVWETDEWKATYPVYLVDKTNMLLPYIILFDKGANGYYLLVVYTPEKIFPLLKKGQETDDKEVLKIQVKGNKKTLALGVLKYHYLRATVRSGLIRELTKPLHSCIT